MSVQVSYMGSRILNLTSDGTKKLTTKGKVCTDDITVQNTQDGGITPSGTIHINANGTYDVTDKANAVVDVPSDAPIDEAVTVTQNGVTNVPTGKRYNPITVNVPVPTDTTATASDIAGGKTAYIGGSKVTGTAVIETNSRLYKVNIPSAITTGTVSIMTAVPEITAHFNDTALTVELLPKFSIASTDTAVYCFILAGNSYVMEAQYAVSVYKGGSGAMSIVKSALPLNTSSAISSALKVTSGGNLQVRCGSNYQLFAGDYDIRISW